MFVRTRCFVRQRLEKRGRGVCKGKGGREDEVFVRTRCFVRQRLEKRGRGVCKGKGARREDEVFVNEG